MKCFTFLFLILCFIFVNQALLAQNSNFLDPNVAPIIEELGASVNVIVKQPDGKILVGGFFYMANDNFRHGLARFNPDGSLDESFNPLVSTYPVGVRTIIVQPDGKILVGGQFDSFAIPHRNIVRLNSDGSEDTSFTANTNSAVYAIALQPDGKILIGGAFTEVNNGIRFGTARLNIDGSIDTSFNLSLRTVFAIAVQPDGNILLGGSFALTTPNVVTRIARVSNTGTIDTAFSANASADSIVEAIKLQSDGKILLGGLFSKVNGVNQTGIARLNINGTYDSSFVPVISGGRPSVESIDLDSTGKVLIGGNFTIVNGTPRPYVAKLTSDGTLDTTFAPIGGANAAVRAVRAESDDNSLIGGEFLNFNGTTKNRLARLNATGELISSFSGAININGRVYDIEIQPDGKFIVAGSFHFINGTATGYIARFLPDGTLDPSFATYSQSQFFGQPIEDIEILPDGKIMVAGFLGFTANVNVTYHVIRLNTDGTVDNTFAPVRFYDSSAKVVKSLPNGQVIVGGNKLIKINSNGTIDTSFNPTFSADSSVSLYDINIRNDGKIFVGGYFQTVNGTAKKNLALLNQNGTLDTGFSAEPSSIVYSIEKLFDNKLLISGAFTSVNGTPRNNVAKLLANGQLDISFNVDAAFAFPMMKIKVLPDGKIILAGQKNYFSTITSNFVVLNPNGSINTFLPNNHGFNGGVHDIEVQSDGKILVGGQFTRVGTSTRYALARLNSINFSGKTLFDFDGDNKTDISIFRPSVGEWWYLKSSSGSNGAFQFGSSTDKIVPADYTGDGKTDIAFFRPSTGVWFVLRSEDNSFYSFPFGASGDVPAPADYDGDGKSDAAVFRPSNLTWYILRSSGGVTIQEFGVAGDVPTVSDYDGDGRADIAIYRPNAGQWWILRSSAGIIAYQFGASADKPVQGDYTGDGKTDVAFFRPSTGEWFILRSENESFYSFPFGTTNDVPSPGDYDGDGKTDAAVFRPSNQTWFAQRSTSGTLIQGFGIAGDVSVPNSFVP